ncbi:MAG TPA: hypothetical protein ENI20_17000 [Bacteroides sp.]|nr:hypothetical protein [Bacteroides sp.]
MVLDNKKTAIKVYLWKMIQACVTVLLLIGIMITGWFEKDLLGITKYQWVILVSLVYLILIIVSRLRKLNFFYFSDEGDKILIRYYPIQPLVQKKKAVQIPKIGLAGYDINTVALGLKKVLILRQTIKGKVAIYPPIGITTLKRKEIDLLKKHLDKYIRN